MPPEPESIKLLLVDDHQVVRMGLRTLFETSPGIEVVGDAANVAEAVGAAARLAPDVVLMDMRLPDGSGVDACREILAASPDVRVLFLTSYGNEEAMIAAVFAGAHGYLLKEIDGEALVNAVRNVAAGQSILDAKARRAIVDRMRALSGPDVAKDASESLSEQEKRVLALVAHGKTNKEIAAVLDLSDKTVKNYLHNIFRKLGTGHRAEAAVIYAKHINR